MRRGLTIIEMLAVLTLLALVTSIGAYRAAAVVDHADLRTLAARVQALDAVARLHARTNGPTIIVVDQRQREVAVLHSHSGERIGSAMLPEVVGIEVYQLGVGDGALVFTIAIDRTGRSIDYAVTLEDGVQQRRWTVAGLTGAVIDGEPEVEP